MMSISPVAGHVPPATGIIQKAGHVPLPAGTRIRAAI